MYIAEQLTLGQTPINHLTLYQDSGIEHFIISSARARKHISVHIVSVIVADTEIAEQTVHSTTVNIVDIWHIR